MSNLKYEDMYNSLRRLHDSTNTAVSALQEENKLLKEEIKISHQKLENAQSALDINKEIMRNALLEQNNIKDTYSREISDLKEEIKKLKKVK